MAIRTTDTAVGKIIELNSSIDVTPFIEIASALVDSVCVPLTYTGTQLELIERWLSAHFYAIRDPRAKREKAGPVSQEVQSDVKAGLNVTHYGQMAMTADFKGGLASLDKSTQEGKSRTIGIQYLGTTTLSQEIAYDQT